MAIVSRFARLRFDGAAGAFRLWTATASAQDTPEVLSVAVQVDQSSVGLAPGVADTLTLNFYNGSGGLIRAIALTPGSATQTATFYFTDTGSSGGNNRHGTVFIDIRATKTTGGPTATYDYETDGAPATPPSTFTAAVDRGYIRGTTTVTLAISNISAGGAQSLPASFPDSLFVRLTAGSASYINLAQTLILSEGASVKRTGTSAAGTGPTWDVTFSGTSTAAGRVNDGLSASSHTLTASHTFPNDATTGLPYTTQTVSTADTSGNSRTGYLGGTTMPAVVTTPLAGLSFDGVDLDERSSVVNCGTTGFGVATADGSMQIKATIRRGRTGVAEAIACKDDGVSSAGINWGMFVDASNKLTFRIVDSGGTIVSAVGTTSLAAATNYDVEGNWTGSVLNVKVNSVQEGTTPALTALQAPDATTQLTIGRFTFNPGAGAAPYPFQGTIASVVMTRGGVIQGNYALTSINSGLTSGTIITDPRRRRVPLFQLDDNSFGTPPSIKHNASNRRQTTQQGFLASRTINARGEGQNGLTYNVTLTPRRPGTALSQTGIVTTTQGGEAGWSTSLMAWSSSLPGGIWDKAYTYTAPADVTNAAHTSQVAGTSTEYLLIAKNPDYEVRVNVHHASDQDGRHFSAGMAVAMATTLIDFSTGKRVDPALITSATFSIVRAKPSALTGLSNTYQYFDGTNWLDWTAGTSQTTFTAAPSPVDAQTYEYLLANTASYGLTDFRINGLITSEGVTYAGTLVVTNLDTKNQHDGGASGAAASSGGGGGVFAPYGGARRVDVDRIAKRLKELEERTEVITQEITTKETMVVERMTENEGKQYVALATQQAAIRQEIELLTALVLANA